MKTVKFSPALIFCCLVERLTLSNMKPQHWRSVWEILGSVWMLMNKRLVLLSDHMREIPESVFTVQGTNAAIERMLSSEWERSAEKHTGTFPIYTHARTHAKCHFTLSSKMSVFIILIEKEPIHCYLSEIARPKCASLIIMLILEEYFRLHLEAFVSELFISSLDWWDFNSHCLKLCS